MRKILCLLILFSSFQAARADAGTVPSVFSMGGTPYVSLNALSDAQGFQYAWDPLLKNATLTGSRGFVKCHIGSSYILCQNRVYKLEEKVRLYKGSVVAPMSVTYYLDQLADVRYQVPRVDYQAPSVTQQIYGAGALGPGPRLQRVVIDAGHGGKDHGAISPRGTHEKEIVLGVARLVGQELESHGLEVIYTRDADYYLSLEDRAWIANSKNADFFVSIHANASRNASLKGFEIYYHEDHEPNGAAFSDSTAQTRWQTPNWGKPDIAYDETLAAQTNKDRAALSLEAATTLTAAVRRWVDTADQRIRSARFYVLRKTVCPAVLVEMGYITNREEESRLTSPIYQLTMAHAIAKGVLEYKSEVERQTR